MSTAPLTDRQLTELAARAVGIALEWDEDNELHFIADPARRDRGTYFRPLISQQDAFTLLHAARRLIPGGSVVMGVQDGTLTGQNAFVTLYSYNAAERVAVPGSDDEAIRRAIVLWTIEVAKATP